MDTLYLVSVWIIPVVIAITFHEAAHGYVALRFGDDTALQAGRISLNPLRHVDPFGTIILPGMLLLASGGRFGFGFAKPVPVNFWRLRNPKRDMIWVALAGPGMNILLALFSGAVFHLLQFAPPKPAIWLGENLINSIQINAVLAVFNMLPLPPLDGGRVAVGLLPQPLSQRYARLERWGLGILLLLLFILPLIGDKLHVDLNVMTWLLERPVDLVIRFIAMVTGHEVDAPSGM
ncbi:MAG TPA: site-2 protease family protein [Alphaproteobacteria bacterium]|jgi:Zn-dependent protease|nr:site-2 protease family protein [Alphaproteobacteria bacterium]